MSLRDEEIGAGGGRGFLVLLAGYVAVFFALRLLLSSTAGVDDVEQAIFAQSLAWGYNPSQPPLFTWILLAVFKTFGVGLHALALLRYSLLILFLLFFFLSARRLIDDPRLATLAAFSPLLIYYVGWGWHQGFTHTAILTVMCLASFYALVRLVEAGSWPAYAGFGLALGLGLNSKYSFALFAAALLGACLLQEGTRRRIVHVRMLLSLALAALLVLPSVMWILTGFDSYGSIFERALRVEGADDYLTGVALGLWRVVLSSVSFLAPLWVFCLIFFPRAVTRRARTRVAGAVDYERLLGHFFLIIYGLICAGVVFAGVSYVQSRWMHPFLILFPLYYFLRVARAGARGGQIRGFAATLIGVSALAAAFWIAQSQVGPPLCNKCRLYEPYAELARKIADAGFERGTILTENEHIGGNFRMHFRDSRVINMPYSYYIPPLSERPGQCLAVWDAGGSQTLPHAMAGFLEAKLEASLSGRETVRFVEGENSAAKGRLRRLGFIMFPDGAGLCR